MPAVRVLRAAEADVEAIAPLFEAYRCFYGRTSDPIGALAFLRERLERADSAVFFVPLDGRVLGFVQLYPMFSSVHLQRTYVLNDLYVVPAHRRAGVARALLQSAAEFAAAEGAHSITLQTGVDNAVAQALYRSAGYCIDDVFRTFYRRL